MDNNTFPIGKIYDIAFSISGEDQTAFSHLSGDYNPIHLDVVHAQERGFAAPVVYGGLLLAKLSQVIGMSAPGSIGVWSGVKMDFCHPLLVGEQATLQAEISQVSEATRSLVMKVFIRTPNALIASGKAMATLFET